MAHNLSKKQLAWRPNTPKPRRSTKVMFASVVLCLEAIAMLFAAVAMFVIRGRVEGGGLPILIFSLALAVIMFFTCAFVKKPWGIAVGWVLQFVTVALGFVEPTMYVFGVGYLAVWAYCVIKGGQMDRIDDQREREQREWEAAHPKEA